MFSKSRRNTLKPMGSPSIECIHNQGFPCKAEEKVPVFRKTALQENKENTELPLKTEERLPVFKISGKHANLKTKQKKTKIKKNVHISQVQNFNSVHSQSWIIFFFFFFLFCTPAPCKLSLAPKGLTSILGP